jgi:integrase
MSSGGSPRFVGAILKKWRERSLDSIDQIAIDTLAAELYPAGTASTRNRQVYTPVLAILERAGIQAKIKRPKGWTGTRRTFWLRPEPTFALLDAAATQDAEFGIFCTLLNYCGLRLGEAFALDCDEIDLSREFAYLPTTKTDEPRAVYLPPHVVAELASHPGGLDRKGRLFSFRSYRTLYRLLDAACKASGIELPRRVGFHVFRHNYGTWMRIYAGLDSLGLTRLGVWEDMDSVERYSHSEPTAEARQAAKLPTPKRGQVVEIKKVSGE